MSNEPNPDRDELQLKKILRAIDAETIPPDPAVLKSLRDRSADIFMSIDSAGSKPDSISVAISPNESRPTAPNVGQHESSLTSPSAPTTVSPMRTPQRRQPMFSIAARAVMAAAMSVVVLTSWVITNGPARVSAAPLPFARILDQLHGAGILEFQLMKQGDTSQILVKEPGIVRKESTPDRYEIASGTHLWQVDVANNTVHETESTWRDQPDGAFDLLALMDVGVTDVSALLRAKPVERAAFPPGDDRLDSIAKDVASDRSSAKSSELTARKNCLVYRVELPANKGKVRVEAFVDEKDHRLMGIYAWPAGVKRNAGPPLAEMRLIAMNAAVPDDKFEVTSSLTEDGRIGKVTQSQGIVVQRPMLAKRWTPVCSETLLRPGDWLRTELRGANAVKVTLSSDVSLTLGPGSQVEFITPTKARVHNGMVKVEWNPATDPKAGDDQGKPAKPANRPASDFILLAPRTGERLFKSGDKALIRVDREERLVDVAQTPVWLAGFEGTSSNESLGSLIVNLPDGRNEPLAVGYHKVTVEIRDQIARTTIEESFVNNTPGRLEGVFHFPLPQDASISGFGMWIGNELVEADVVEKQRAREIYETILRERRDPGLLEWMGGNIFKARVFPIEARSEKRIKIVYTQVLPMRGNRYRYAYSLRSEMLRTKPLRELSLSVLVNSALALKSVTCPTHTVRTQQTKNSAQVEFAAQEYTPTRDFEVVCEIASQQSDVVIVPHRRGDDGYFLVQITPPFDRGDATGTLTRSDLIPDGNPLRLVLLCDTSASMDLEKRKQQTEFVETVLSSLGPDDRFQIAACDVGTVWSSQEQVGPTADNVAAAVKFLSDRMSLGWTNLDRAFDDVAKKAAAGSQVVYIGDGIVSSGDTDPAAFVKRLAQILGAAKQAREATGGAVDRSAVPLTFHAVTVGSTNESIVMKGIASVGGGSSRAISSEQTPQLVAREFLNEIAQPGLRDVNVEFRGIRVAAVYPGRLPNLPAGSQQILVGRYLPEEGKSDQQGEVIVTGMRGTEKVKYAARISLKNAEEGNSFIPRLWARAHLDHLLAQGSNSLIRDDIIHLSEEFHIITPYTSLLVLETDADRERFGVQRRYEMRDGERFFAEGRNNANFELLHAQMKRAGKWRLDLRRKVLASLASLGRNPQVFTPNYLYSNLGRAGGMPMSGIYAPMGSMSGFGGGGRGGVESFSSSEEFGRRSGKFDTADFGVMLGDRDEDDFKAKLGLPEDSAVSFDGTTPLVTNGRLLLDEVMDFEGDQLAAGRMNSAKRELGKSVSDAGDWAESRDGLMGFKALAGEPGGGGGFGFGGFDNAPMAFNEYSGIDDSRGGRMAYGRLSRRSPQPDYTSWVNSLFPAVSARPPKKTPPEKDPDGWSPDALAIAKSLLRADSLLKLEGGIALRREVLYFDPAWSRSNGRGVDLVLYSPKAWLTRSMNPREQTIIQYCDATERGTYSLAFLLGQTRASVASELKAIPLSLSDHSLASLSQAYAGYTARTEPSGENRVTLILTLKDSTQEFRFLIDTARHVILERTSSDDGKLTDKETFESFVEVAGRSWATKIVTSDDKGRPTTETNLDISTLTEQLYSDRMKAELAAKTSVQFIHRPMPPLRVARQKVADGSATFDDRLMMILHNAQLQQWDELWKHVDAAEKLAADKPGIRWMRTVLLATIRRNEEAQKRFLEEAQRLLPAATQDEVYLAEFILGHVNSLVTLPDFSEVHRSLKPVYFRPFADRLPPLANPKPGQEAVEARASAEIQRQIESIWNDRQASSLEGMGRMDEAMALYKSIAEATPWDVGRQQNYAQKLAGMNQYAAAHAWLRTQIARPEQNTASDETLRSAVAQLYRQQTQWADLLKWTTEWVSRNPEAYARGSYTSPYTQHIAAMIDNDQLDAAYALADRWLIEAQIEGKMTRVQQDKLDAALNFANGSAFDLHFQRVDERWFEPLAQAARFYVRHPKHFSLVHRCVSNHYFAQSDIGDQLRGEWLMMLRNELPKLTSEQIGSLVPWTLSGRIELPEPLNGRKQLNATEIPSDVWTKIADELKVRWVASQEKNEKNSLSESLRSIYATRFGETLLLPFLRERIVSGPVEYKASYLSALFEALLTTKWTDEVEQEAFARWRDLTDKTELSERLAVLLPALLRLDDAMLANRIAAAERQMNDQGDQDKLTRKELAQKMAELRKTARTGLSARLTAEVAKEEQAANQGFGLAFWLKMERSWVDVTLGQNLDQVQTECWKILGDAPPRSIPKDDANLNDTTDEADIDPNREQQDFFDTILRQRAFATLMNLAVRKQAEPASVDRLLKYIDAGIAGEAGAANEDTQQARDFRSFWQMTKFRMLVALDRPEALEKELREWIRTDVSTGPWRQYLARLLAERGKIDEAIPLFEACQKDKLLSGADYKLLADWYLVSNRREDYEKSRIESYNQIPEWQLQQMTYRAQNRWNQGNPPSGQIDEETLYVFKALFQKSAQPQNYLWQLHGIYAATRDFRLLEMLPDSVLGRTPQQIYDFVIALQSHVLYEVRNESTADEIVARIKALRQGDRTVTDLRALDLLEAMVERKSTELINQPGPHIEACLAALQRAFKREWAEGEPILMAHFLLNLGGLPHPKLQDEQLRELRALQQAAKPASREHLIITADRCQLVFFNYSKRDEAIREMEAEVTAWLQTNGGNWPHADNELLGRYVTMLEHAGQHAAGETILKRLMAKAENTAQRNWMNDRLMGLYNNALEHDGAVSIGKGRVALLKPIVELSIKELAAAPDEDVRYSLCVRIDSTFEMASRHTIPGSMELAQNFAFEIMPGVLRQQHRQYRNTATSILRSVAVAMGPKDSLRYVVERMEQWPQRLEIQYENSWNALGYELAGRRVSAGTSDLDPRVLKLAVNRLKSDLRNGDSGNQQIFHDGYGNFWKEKTADFAKAAEEVLGERRSSGRRAMIVATYLRHGLHMLPRATEILLIAHGKSLLDESAQSTLASWLHQENRYAEMIPILEPLVAAHPDNINYRTELMVAFFQSNRPEMVNDLYNKTLPYFHEAGRWTEGTVAQLARGCQGSNQWERAQQLFTEAIALHQRSNPTSGLNDNVLSDLYQNLAQVESRLNHTEAAVTAASAAIVCWDSRNELRQHALNSLKAVLNSAKDLDAYVAHLDAETAKTGQDSPILRKAIGETYQNRSKFEQAITQLKVAVELQPSDAAIHKALIACYDATKKPEEATGQLLKLIDLHAHDLTLYKQLADRLQGNEAEAERAATSIIESSPNEAETHSMMAEIRQVQDRWSEAIPHWQQVAELRKLEPTGLLKLANVQLHLKQYQAAKETVQKLKKTEWPNRFANVVNETRQLEERLPK